MNTKLLTKVIFIIVLAFTANQSYADSLVGTLKSFSNDVIRDASRQGRQAISQGSKELTRNAISTAKEAMLQKAKSSGKKVVTSGAGKALGAYAGAKAVSGVIKNPLKSVVKGAAVAGVGYVAWEASHDGRMELGAKDQADAEATETWKMYYSQLKSMAESIDNKLRNKGGCSSADLKLMATPHKAFMSTANYSLPKRRNSKLEIGDIDAYGAIKTLKTNPSSDKDHIPSFKAIKLFFKNQGYSVSADLADDLKDNASAITIPRDLHRRGRTFGGGNKNFYTQDAKESKLQH